MAGAGPSCKQVIKIGASYSSDESEGLALVGNPTAASQATNYVQEQQALYQLMANYINANGGLAGCKVEMVYHDFKALASDGNSGESESECVDFAQDQHAFAVIPTTLENKTLVTCLAQNHVVDLFGTPTYQPNPQDFATYKGYLYQPSTISSYRFGPFIRLLANAGYLGSGAKVGILLAADGSGNNEYLVDNLWKPALEAMGITPVVFTYNAIESYSGVSTTTDQFSSAVLQFKAAGVNRVMFTPDGGDGVIFFTQAANSQDYDPRYAMTTASVPGAWFSEPSGQRPGAMNVSYSTLDLGESNSTQMATNGTNANRAKCNSIYSGHTGSEPLSAVYFICDDFFFLQEALAGADAVTPQTLLAGADRVAGSLPLAGGYADADFGLPDHYDGGAAVRVMAWNTAADAWQYVSPPEPVPWA